MRIADKIVEMTIEMYREPRKMVEDISALGLRHVGYAIPTEFFAPFVSGAVEVVRTMTTDENAEDGFRWSLTLISKILVRTILEGSTIVMKAINTNQEKALVKAISVSPRGKPWRRKIKSSHNSNEKQKHIYKFNRDSGCSLLHFQRC